MHRLRDLDQAGRLVAVVVLLVLAAPFVASVVHADRLDWRPSSDDALIALRVHDVGQGAFPTTGQPSTADQYDEGDPPRHPGPIEFYLLAAPVALLGYSLGMLVGTALFAFGAIAVAVWVAFRRGGRAVGLGAAVVCSTIAWSEGQAVLSDPISSNVGGIPLLALAALAWAVLDGDIRLVPLAAFVFAFVAQAHLAILGVAVGTASWLGVGIVLTVAAWRQGRRGRPIGRGTSRSVARLESEDQVGDELVAGATERSPSSVWPWLIAGGVVSVVAWAPVLADQFAGSGNISRIAGFAGSADRPHLGIRSGVTQALRSLAVPPLLGRTDLTGSDIKAALSPAGVVSGLMVIGALGAIAVTRWRSARGRAALAATTLVMAALGAWNGANVPASLEAQRINFYRWAFVVSAGVTGVLAWEATTLGQRWLASRSISLRPRFAPVVAVVAVLAVTAVSAVAIVGGKPSARRDEGVFDLEDHFNAAALRAVEGKHRVLLIADGASASLSTGPALALDLVNHGHEIRVPPNDEAGYGADRVIRRGERVDGVLQLRSTTRPVVARESGELLARVDINDRRRQAAERLAAQVRDQRPVRSPQFRQILARAGAPVGSSKAILFEAVIKRLATNPIEAFRNAEVVRLLQAGYLVRPVLPAEDLDVLARISFANSWGDEYFELRSLTPAEAERSHDLDLG